MDYTICHSRKLSTLLITTSVLAFLLEATAIIKLLLLTISLHTSHTRPWQAYERDFHPN